jgi:glycosyltransferase involved in cell wall biosynthesis
MEKIIFSIVIPFYNGEFFINRLLKSIELSYNLEPSKTVVEIHLIVDSPQTKIVELEKTICSNISSDFKSRITIHKNEINLGVANSRNKGLELCKGTFITFIDQDDTVDISYFQELSVYLNNYNYDMYILNGYYIHMNSNKKVPLYFKNPKITLKSFLRQNQIITPGLIVFKKDFLITNSLSFIDADKSFKGCDDWYLYLDILDNVKFKYLFLNKGIYNYYYHDSNFSNNIEESTLASMATINYFMKKCNNKNINLYRNNILRLNFEMLLYVSKLGILNSLMQNPAGFKYFVISHITNLNRMISFIYRKAISMPLKV